MTSTTMSLIGRHNLEAHTNLIILLAVHLAILVEVLSVKYLAAGFALEAPNVPVIIECDQRLSISDLIVAGVACCMPKDKIKIKWK